MPSPTLSHPHYPLPEVLLNEDRVALPLAAPSLTTPPPGRSLPQVLLNERTAGPFRDHYLHLLAVRLLGPPPDQTALPAAWGAERTLLQALPVMPTAAAMLADVDRGPGRMAAFRQHVMARIDEEEAEYCPALALAVQPSAFHAHVLSPMSWPKAALSPAQFSSLRLPDGLATLADEFERFFHAWEGSASVLYDAHAAAAAGGTDHDGRGPAARSVDDLAARLLHAGGGDGGLWPRGEEGSGGEHAGLGRAAGSGTSRKRLLWCHAAGTVTLAFHVGGAAPPQRSLLSSPRSRPPFAAPTTVTLVVSTPQAAVLMALDVAEPAGGLGPGGLTERALGEATGLHGDELRAVTRSLSDPSQPLLSTTTTTTTSTAAGVAAEPVYRLADALLTGAVGLRRGGRGEQPVVADRARWAQATARLSRCPAVAAGTDTGADAGTGVGPRNWRESLIDACIVRELKKASRDGSGRTALSMPALLLGSSHALDTALTVEELAGRVKDALEARRLRVGGVPVLVLGACDVAGRCEALVDGGYIEAVAVTLVGPGAAAFAPAASPFADTSTPSRRAGAAPGGPAFPTWAHAPAGPTRTVRFGFTYLPEAPSPLSTHPDQTPRRTRRVRPEGTYCRATWAWAQARAQACWPRCAV